MARASTETTSIPVSSKTELIDEITTYTCLRNCMGNKGTAGSCCSIGDRDYIIGPVHDAAQVLERLSALRGREVPHDEVFIDYEEGSALFPERPFWQKKECFPAIRVNTEDAAMPCIFLADDNLCSIHAIRSETCGNYSCDHLKSIFQAL